MGVKEEPAKLTVGCSEPFCQVKIGLLQMGIITQAKTSESVSVEPGHRTTLAGKRREHTNGSGGIGEPSSSFEPRCFRL